jgi:hypothetical protein
MWETVCTAKGCTWSSKTRQLQEAALVLGRLHEEDYPGHKVVLRDMPRVRPAQPSNAD